MPLPTNKIELLEKLEEAYKKLDGEFEELLKNETRKKEIEGGVSACDLLAYQIEWGKLLLGWEKQEQAGKNPSMPSQDYKWNELGALAHMFYKKHQKDTLDTLRRDFKITVRKIVSLINALSEKELFEPRQRNWTGEKWPMVKWIQINTIAPYSSARMKLRRWKKTLN